MKEQTMELREILKDYLKDNNSNHWIRRFFRCYIDGSYKGAKHYKRNCEYIKANKDNKKKLRTFVISAFVDILSIEFADISRGTVQNVVLDTICDYELEQLNNELIDDALDLIRE